MREKEYIAYLGPCFTIEWYYDEEGNSQAFDFFDGLSAEVQDKLLYLLKRMGDFGKISDKTKFRHEGDQIYAFKPKPDRFLCFFTKGKRIIITNAFEKDTDKLPKAEKKKAVDSRENYSRRVKGGKYYMK